MDLSSVSFDTLCSNYPTRTEKEATGYSTVDLVMTDLPGTPCCVQMSCAFNRSGLSIPSSSWRPRNSMHDPDPGKQDTTLYYYMLAVDEMEAYLTDIAGEGEQVNASGRHGFAAISNYLQGRTGILTFRSADLRHYGVPHVFEHIELWVRDHMLQRMSPSLFDSNYVKYWDIGLASGPPAWLTKYMQAM